MANSENEVASPEAIYAESAAYARGIEAGKTQEKPENPYSEGSVEAKAFEHGYADGQKIRTDEKPPAGA